MIGATSSAYALAAMRGRGKRKHIIVGETVYGSGDFQTLCGMWGSTKQMPWVAGSMRLDSGGWCLRCTKKAQADSA